MLNISPVSINRYIDRKRFSALRNVEEKTSGRVLLRLIGIASVLACVCMFLPWTQNIRALGTVTTLKPAQRPQTIHSIIGGRIEEWFVQEGDFVRKGDTILHISEIKSDYLDPELLTRTENQLKAKENSVGAYKQKVEALDNQISALTQTRDLKRKQAQNKLRQSKLKVASDSISYEAAAINFDIAAEQYKRAQELYKEGLKSLTDTENRKLKWQKAQADWIAKENKLLTSRNDVLNAEVELRSIDAKYRDNVAKAQSNRSTAYSNMFDAEAGVTKLQNQYTNYSVRTSMYYILAPQDGYITKAIQSGLGETIKEGEKIVSIMPADYQLAVEMYVKPIDLPLLSKNQEVRIQFDGWPAIVFGGWPNTSYGTYGGRVFAIDNFISENGKYRVLVAPDEHEQSWPGALRVGAGTNNLLLLKNVSVGYELWRQMNGFPPDYYKIDEKKEKPKSKAPKLKLPK